MSLPCLILAAGFGTRMGELSRDRPKALIEVAGMPLIAHALAAARAGGAGPIAVNAHYRAEALTGWLRVHAPDVHVLHESPDILDSGGAIKNALAVLGEGPLFTLNADAVWEGEAPLAALVRVWDPERMEALLALVPRGAAVGRQGGGDFARGGDGRLVWDKGPDGAVYVGAQVIDPARIAANPARIFPLRDTWEEMRGEGRLFGMMHAGRWADVGHPGGITAAEEMLGHDADL
ncbi:NTP transferase domain-containing protein [Roseibacterium sp. SDUM158016]|uniref:NTP transferase domain-containing protein n=1 Tax=Roseicyclus sediminis TaxID=2980997 RepID=UPI0021D2D025|nr:NTP transferase domain-containing protein [Roseibacterium sp. SDUM158016]MCU4652481.1 NTP transferase domain-containing protein [Roseibacterium sp. SDUM158016]